MAQIRPINQFPSSTGNFYEVVIYPYTKSMRITSWLWVSTWRKRAEEIDVKVSTHTAEEVMLATSRTFLWRALAKKWNNCQVIWWSSSICPGSQMVMREYGLLQNGALDADSKVISPVICRSFDIYAIYIICRSYLKRSNTLYLQ